MSVYFQAFRGPRRIADFAGRGGKNGAAEFFPTTERRRICRQNGHGEMLNVSETLYAEDGMRRLCIQGPEDSADTAGNTVILP